MARLPTPQIVEVNVVARDDIEDRLNTFTSMLSIAINKRNKKEGRCQDDTQEKDYR